MQKVLIFVKRYRTALVSAAVLAALLIFLSFSGGRNDQYAIEAVYDDAQHTLTVSQRVEMTNRTGVKLDALYFHLYANAFADQKGAPVLRADFQRAYPNGFDAGGVEMTGVRLNDNEADWALDGPQNTLLRVQLPTPLPRNGSATVELFYTVRLPQGTSRMGWSEHDVRLGNSFAVLCYHDGAAWRLDGYDEIGDPFLSTVADYRVTLRAPEKYVVAAPGLVGAKEGVWRFKGNNMREFALVLSPDLNVMQRTVDGTVVKAFAETEQGAQQALDYACQALTTFNALYGRYAYPDLVVTSADFYVGGMEYPAFMMVDRSLFTQDDGMLEFVIAHEVAHQWWYAAVGSDQIQHPWQDESLAEYSTLLYYEAGYGGQSFDSLYQSMVRPALEMQALRGQGLDAPISAFASNSLYDALIYRKGAGMWHDLRVRMGNDAFLAALQNYYKENRFAVAAPQDLMQALGGEAAARALEWLRGDAP